MSAKLRLEKKSSVQKMRDFKKKQKLPPSRAKIILGLDQSKLVFFLSSSPVVKSKTLLKFLKGNLEDREKEHTARDFDYGSPSQDFKPGARS